MIKIEEKSEVIFQKENQVLESNPNQENLFADNKMLSIIIRSHKEDRLPFLEEALFSLAIQDWEQIEVVVVLQNGTDQFKRAVSDLIKQQPWPKNPLSQIHTVNIPGGMDGRSTLLNHGMKYATGRYLCFLDDDDVVYQHGYITLIEQLIVSGKAIAVGGCRTSKVQNESDHWYVQVKETPFAWGRTRYDLFRDNFIPIHSYVIDRTRVKGSDLYFDDDFPPLEDYDFLLRLSSKYDFDFSKLDVFVCEYRIHNSNSLPYTSDAPPEAIAKHARALERINKRKKEISCTIPLIDLIDFLKPVDFKQSSVSSVVTEAENLRLVKKLLDSFGNNIYTFFNRYPRIEKRLSNTIHYGWKVYSRIKKQQ